MTSHSQFLSSPEMSSTGSREKDTSKGLSCPVGRISESESVSRVVPRIPFSPVETEGRPSLVSGWDRKQGTVFYQNKV